MRANLPALTIVRALVAAGSLLALSATGGTARPERKEPVATPVDFSSQIAPVLSSKCYSCHGQDEGTRKAGLRLDVRDEAIKEHKGRRALVPGKPEASEVVRRITTDDPDDLMPPPKAGHALSPAEIDLIKRWIQQGASYSQHWAFVPPERTPLPEVRRRSWARNPVDFYILEKLEAAELKPSPEADRHALIRRLSLDLTGLPPTPSEVEAFVKDRKRDAYERLVDRLLASPAYGERWARIWLDLARYADSAGYGSDPLRLNIWPWRDWVINALNRNLAFDQFTVEQIAGDLLPGATDEQRIATAFHRNTMTNTEGGTDDEEFRVAAIKDRANVTGQVWMGLTVGCAQCHSHKYDPISQREYYRFYAFFNQTEDNDQPDERPTLPLPTPEQRSKIDRLKEEIAGLEKERDKVTPELEKELAEWEARQKRGVDWIPLEPVSLRSSGGANLTANPGGTIVADGPSPETDTYTVRVRTDLTNITALRLELLPDDRLPKQGPGRAAGTGGAVLTELQGAVRSAATPLPRARYVRVELPGSQRILSLAEVQIFNESGNVASKGTARQSSVAGGAEARRAIDGNTAGDLDGGSTTLSEAEDNPWWEVDLGAETALDEIAIWNRTDKGLGTRLNDFKVLALDGARKTVWEKSVNAPPNPATYLRVPAEKTLKLQNASADHADKDQPVAQAVDGSQDAKNGWRVGERAGQSHTASFEIDANPVTEKNSLLLFTLVQKFGTNHTIGRFRLSATTQPLPVREVPLAKRAILALDPAQRTPPQREELIAWFRDFAPSRAEIRDRIRQRRKDLDEIKPVALPVMKELASEKRRETRALNKGNFLDPGDKVEPAVLTAFHRAPESAPANRLGLAQWLVSRDNPLTARVMANRLWAQLFGVGLVETEEDFGTQGAMPTHRELLDWLALEFMDGSWNVKALLKTMVMSATYRQSAEVTPDRLEKDPRNRLCSRAPRLRLDAEMVRDQALALSGLLSRKIGGPSVYPMQPDGLWRAAFNGERTWATSKGEDRHRRGLYTFWRRTVPYPSMATFDAPSRENCTVRRIPTNTPLQAFVTLNDPVFLECAQALGRRLVREGGERVSDRVRYGLELCLARRVKPEQVKALVELYERELQHYRSHEPEALKLATEPLGPLPEGWSAAEAAAWTSVANVLLNLDGVLTRS